MDLKRAKTDSSRLGHLLGFIEHYSKQDVYLTNDKRVTDDILFRYITFLLSGFTIQANPIMCGTIKGYLSEVNKHYSRNGFREPFDNKDGSPAAAIFAKAQSFEAMPERREPLTRPMCAMMRCLAKNNKTLGFRAALWNFTVLCIHLGYREQEYAMESCHIICYYVLPDNRRIARAFVRRNFIAYMASGARIKNPLQNWRQTRTLGNEFDVQKNRMNGQIVKVGRFPTKHRDYCPVENGLDIIAR